MEILAPAGNREALERAAAAGADAVYLGYSAFNARAGAGNFDREGLAEALRFAHLRHMRVYVTVNTLIKDEELSGIRELLTTLRDLKADGILVQDPGVLRIARREFPELKLHASTQMAIHNAAGVRYCEELGMTRVVLARECDMKTIRKACEVGPEIEVFVHGAQCVAASGLCLFSSMVGGRSGNRGRCAQPCRMQYRFRGKEGAWLSPRDNCLRNDLPALREAGVASLKIEGRLKRAEYAGIVSASYRKGLDSLEAGRFAEADEKEETALRQIFTRGEFMRGYAAGCQDAGVILPGNVKHTGIEIGIVTGLKGNLARVRAEREIHNGDGLRVVPRDGKSPEIELIYAGKPIPAGEEGLIRLREGAKAGRGDRVFRLTDEEQLAAERGRREKPVPVQMSLKALPGEALTLTVTDGESVITVKGEALSEARSREATAEELAVRIGKTGDTVFAPGEITVDTKGAFVPVAGVNALRREALEKLAEERIRRFEEGSLRAAEAGAWYAPLQGYGRADEDGVNNEREAGASGAWYAPLQGCGRAVAPSEGVAEKTAAGAYIPFAGRVPEVTVRAREQAEVARQAGFLIAWRPEDYRDEALDELFAGMNPGEWFCLPDVCDDETLCSLARRVEDNRENLGGVILGTVGQLGIRWSVPYGAGTGIPVMNREAAEALREAGCAFYTPSPELTGKEAEALIRESALPARITVYGRTRLMLLQVCPARTVLGLTHGHERCALCDTGDENSLRGQCLEDRMGYRFPLLRQRLPGGCRIELMNALPTDLCAEDTEGIRAAELTAENEKETESILNAFAARKKTPGETTAGHWRRPVE